jgi:hypothetical protein
MSQWYPALFWVFILFFSPKNLQVIPLTTLLLSV